MNGVPLNWIFPSVIKQYFSPYASADMTKMAQAFNTTVTDLEDELSNLILEGQIQARIDSHNKVREIRLEVWRLTFGGGGKNCELCAQPPPPLTVKRIQCYIFHNGISVAANGGIIFSLPDNYLCITLNLS